jgi:thiaminase/transcriptional activator TenA
VTASSGPAPEGSPDGGRPGDRLSTRLWADSADITEQVLTNPFVVRLGDGSLPRSQFARFIAQDAFFLDAFARAYALALVRSSDTATLLVLADLIAGVRDELRLHTSYAARWGIDVARVEPAATTTAYTDFLLASAATDRDGVVFAAMTPCMRLYAHLGQILDASAAGPYAEWVQTYAHADFTALAERLEGLLDDQCRDPNAARAAYRRAMTLELEFFTAAST